MCKDSLWLFILQKNYWKVEVLATNLSLSMHEILSF